MKKEVQILWRRIKKLESIYAFAHSCHSASTIIPRVYPTTSEPNIPRIYDLTRVEFET